MNLRPLAVTVAVTLTSVAAACGPHERTHEARVSDVVACDRAVYGELIRMYPADYLRFMAPCNNLTQDQWNTVIETATQDAVNAWAPAASN